MKKVKLILSGLAVLISLGVYGQSQAKYISSKSHIKFFSTTPVEDIEANNYASVSTIKPTSGEVVFSVPMQSFEFEKALMQQHFNNEHFLETNVYPKSKLTGRIINLKDVNFAQNGKYSAEIEGELTIKGITKPVKETGTIVVENDVVKVSSQFNVILADFGITFDEKDLVSTKIAKEVEVTVNAEYDSK